MSNIRRVSPNQRSDIFLEILMYEALVIPIIVATGHITSVAWPVCMLSSQAELNISYFSIKYNFLVI